LKKKIVIRVDGGTRIGMGHIVRCQALADMLSDNFDITFAVQEPINNVLNLVPQTTTTIVQLPATTNYQEDASNFSNYLKGDEIVVVDGYNFQTAYQQTIKNIGCKLVAIDDLHGWYQVADIVINHANGANQLKYHAAAHTQFYLGLDYVLLRNEFLNADTPKREITHLRKVFISMGAADFTNITQKFVNALLEVTDVKEINLLLGDVNPNLEAIQKMVSQHPLRLKSHVNLSAAQIAALLKVCDVCICPASTISLESCAIGIVLISGYTAQNQVDNLKGMEKSQTLINFGNLNELSVAAIKNKFETVAANTKFFRTMLDHQQKIIDGKSPERIAAIFKQLI
jgi:UDP-2,4-diacetamido-2,4,6-trideoxy-beta-L-altropyranose hydrolase